MKHGQTHPKFWFWYCTVCISMAGPCRADTTNPARGWIYENIAHKIMEMSALITHTIQFFFTFIVDHLDAKQFAIRHFPEKIDHKYFLSKKPQCVFIIRWMTLYMVLTFSSVHFLFSLLCLFSFVLRFFFEILDFNLFYFQLYSTYIVHRYSDIHVISLCAIIKNDYNIHVLYMQRCIFKLHEHAYVHVYMKLWGYNWSYVANEDFAGQISWYSCGICI